MPSAAELQGKVVLVGLVFFAEDGSVLKQEQRHGTIVGIGSKGLELKLSSGEAFFLPPDLGHLQAAPPGSFSEHSPGDTVRNPDFIANWFLIRKESSPDAWTWRPGPRFAFPGGPGAGRGA